MKRFSPSWLRHHALHNPLSTWIWGSKTLYQMMATRETQCLPHTNWPFRIDAWEDLEEFQPTKHWHRKESLLTDDRKKLDDCSHCVTLVHANQIALINWIHPGSSREVRFNHIRQTILFPDQTAARFSGDVHRRQTPLLKILDYLFKHPDPKYGCTSVERGHAVAYRANVKIGFETTEELGTKCVFCYDSHLGQSTHPCAQLKPEDRHGELWGMKLRADTHQTSQKKSDLKKSTMYTTAREFTQ